MNCPYCGAPNNDYNNNCVNCGNPLRPVQYQQQYAYMQPQNQVQRPVGAKPTALYMIAGALAVLGFVLTIIPSIRIDSHDLSPISFLFEAGSIKRSSGMGRTDRELIDMLSNVMFMMYIPPMILQVVWAVLSFMQKKAAGILGVIASAYYSFSTFYWWFFTMIASSESSNISSNVIPSLMLMAGIAGIPISIIQIVKKKYL